MALELRSGKKKKNGGKMREVENDVQALRGSFNPFAALCIGITGMAMAAHHQTYVFQVRMSSISPLYKCTHRSCSQ